MLPPHGIDPIAQPATARAARSARAAGMGPVSPPPAGWLLAVLLMTIGLSVFPSTATAEEERGDYLWVKKVRGEYQEVLAAVQSAMAIGNFPVSNVRDYRESFSRRFEQIGGGELPFTEYRILEFCNVQLAIETLGADLRMGIFMPCRMVVFQGKGEDVVTLMTVNPDFMPKALGNPALSRFAKEVKTVILEIFDAVEF